MGKQKKVDFLSRDEFNVLFKALHTNATATTVGKDGHGNSDLQRQTRNYMQPIIKS